MAGKGGGGGGGGGFEIAKAFVTIEARLKEDTFDAAKRAAQQKLSGPGGPGPAAPPPSGGTPAPTGPRTPTGPAPTGGATREPGVGNLAQQVTSAVSEGFRRALSNLAQRAPGQQPQQPPASTRATATQPVVQAAPRVAPTVPQAGRDLSPDAIADRVVGRMNARTPMRQNQPLSQVPMRGGVGGGGTTVNNYNTQVRIDPRKIDELLRAIRIVNQLRARNRARPSSAPTFEPRKVGASSKRQQVVNGSRKKAIETLAQNATLLYKIKTGAISLGSLGLGFLESAGGLQAIKAMQVKAARRERKFREERITRYRKKGKAQGKDVGRKQGQFYFNKKFRGAKYRDFEATNSGAIATRLQERLKARGDDVEGGRIDLSALRIQDRFRRSRAARGETGKGSRRKLTNRVQRRSIKKRGGGGRRGGGDNEMPKIKKSRSRGSGLSGNTRTYRRRSRGRGRR